MLRDGSVFGKCSDAAIETYMSRCHVLYPLHSAFRPPGATASLSLPPTSAEEAASLSTKSPASAAKADCEHMDAIGEPVMVNGNNSLTSEPWSGECGYYVVIIMWLCC